MDPKPIKHVGALLAFIRDKIEPALTASGFRFARRNNPWWSPAASRWIDYSRGGDTFSIRFERGEIVRIVAELMDAKGNVFTVCQVILDGPTMSYADLMDCLTQFVQSVNRYVQENLVR